MIQNIDLIEKFEKKLLEESNSNLENKFRILDSMYELAHELGIIPLKNPLEGIETDIRIAKIINSL